ncbi:hypothetical protein [Streptomyces rimosus]|uniref:hypothetical protein n=1 Tax=Streptomyces rimosus TaxID=1927 RepID=UPI003CD02F38
MSNNPRLLPWPGLAGQRSYLVTDDNGGILSRLADEMEEVQLIMGPNCSTTRPKYSRTGRPGLSNSVS